VRQSSVDVSTADNRHFQGTSLHRTRPLEQQNTHNVLQLIESFLYHHIGVKVVFKVALVVLKFSLGRQHVLKKCPTMCETLEVLRHPPQGIMDEEFVVYQVTANTRIELIFFMCTCVHHVYQCIAVVGFWLPSFPKENENFFVKSFSFFLWVQCLSCSTFLLMP